MNCYSSYSQKLPQIKLSIIDSDTVFIMNRQYAEMMAKTFDSLDRYKIKYNDCIGIIDTFISLNERYKLTIDNADNQILSLKNENLLLKQVITSHHKTEFIYDDISKKLTKEERKRRIWQSIAIGGISVSTVTLILIFIK